MGNQLKTLDEILDKLLEDRYVISKRTFQFYVQSGLLPKGVRKGSEKGGVQFYYPSSVIKTIKKILELKGKGHSLNDIKKRLSSEEEAQGSSTPDTALQNLEIIRGDSMNDNVFKTAEKVNFGVLNKVMSQTPGGETLKLCLQCGTCGGSCPSAEDMDHTPRHLFSMLQAGLTHEVLSSNTPWFCVSCYYCTVRCPQQIPITEIMYTLKQLAVKQGVTKITDAYDFSRTFVNLVEKYGRSFDFGLALRYHLTHNPMSKVSWGSLALKMYKKERMVTGPSKIRDIEGLARILDKAKKIGGVK